MDFSHLAFEFQWEQCFSIVDKWKSTMLDHILSIHREKYSEIELYKQQAEKECFVEKKNFILNMNEYFQHPCILSYEIDSFKTKLIELKQNIIQRPLPLHIEIEEKYFLNNPIRISPMFSKQQIFKEKKILAEFQIDTLSIRLIATSNNRIILVNNQSRIFLYDKLIGFIKQWDMSDYTTEYLNDICWSNIYRNFLFLCDHSLWSLENLVFKKLAHISNKKNFLFNLTTKKNYLFLIYNQGEFIDRWIIEPEWKLEKRWMKYYYKEILISIHSNENYLLLYTNKAIELCTDDLIIQYSIDLINQEHFFSNFCFISTYQIWLTVDKQTQILYYFHLHDRNVKALEQIFARAICSMGDELAFITKEDFHLQIVSI